MMRNRVKKILFFIMFAFCGGVLLFVGSVFIKPESVSAPSLTQGAMTIPNAPAPENETTTVIMLTGDIMLARGVEYAIKKKANGDFTFPFLNIAKDLKEADILFGNLEGPISDKGVNVGSIYSFRADPKAIDGLSYAGFDVLSIANNHAFDYTDKALEDTFLRLKAAGIDYVGGGMDMTEAFSPVIKNVNGVRIGFLAYTNLGSSYWKAREEKSGIAWLALSDLEKIKEDIANAKKQSDILIVSIHAGEEYTQELTQFQIEFSRAAIDAGADIIAGHHPHVVQKNEKYENGWIFYSLGNFIFDQNFSEETMRGQIVKITVKNRSIEKVITIDTKQNRNLQPEIKETERK